MSEDNFDIKCELIPYDGFIGSQKFDFDKIIYDLNSQIELLSCQADNLDYIVAIASGMACGLLDILWVGEFDLQSGHSIASDKVDSFVKKTAEMLERKKFDDVKSAVKALEKRFPIPSDGNTPNFGGGLQHHIRDFAHHPTIVGLAFSLLTQFTEKSYGTDVNGVFLVVDVPKKSKPFIGNDVPQKILMGTITWFFHLVSDVAGSSSTAGISGGTGIPGPILALAKEIATIPFFKDIKVTADMSLSLFLSKMFNGSLMMQRDENGQIIKESVIKFDLRGELGVTVELCKQAVPVIANECIVRAFYFIRHLAMVMKENCVSCLADMKKIEWSSVKPANNPTIARMLTVSTGVFSLWQKTFTPAVLPLRSKPNRGEVDQYYTEDTQEAIIDKATFQKAQQMLNRRAEKSKTQPKTVTPKLARMIYCGDCGRVYKPKGPNEAHRWVCSASGTEGRKCATTPITEYDIEKTFVNMYNRLKQNADVVLRKAYLQLSDAKKRIALGVVGIAEIDKEIAELSNENSMYLKFYQQNMVDEVTFREQTGVVGKRISELRVRRQRLLSDDKDEACIDSLRNILEELQAMPEALLWFDRDVFDKLIAKIIVSSKTALEFELKCGIRLKEQIEWD